MRALFCTTRYAGRADDGLGRKEGPLVTHKTAASLPGEPILDSVFEPQSCRRAACGCQDVAGHRPSVVRPPGVWADQHVLLKAEIVCDGGETAPVSVPPLAQHGLDSSPPLPPPPVHEHGDRLAVAVRVLEAIVQIPLVPRHDQEAAHRWLRGWGTEPMPWN